MTLEKTTTGPARRGDQRRHATQHEPGRARRRAAGVGLGLLTLLGGATAALAQEEPALDSGDTAWMLTSTALVLMMTIPGLAMFYAGMVRKKNVLTMSMQVFATCCV